MKSKSNCNKDNHANSQRFVEWTRLDNTQRLDDSQQDKSCQTPKYQNQLVFISKMAEITEANRI